MDFLEGRELVKKLKDTYHANKKEYTSSDYNETQLRNDFLNPMLRAFGWDVDNDEKKPQYLRDVIQEYYIEEEDKEEKTKKPDYSIRLHVISCLF